MSFTTIYSTFQLLYASFTIEVFPDVDLDLFAIYKTRFKRDDSYSPRVVRHKNTEYMQAQNSRE